MERKKMTVRQKLNAFWNLAHNSTSASSLVEMKKRYEHNEIHLWSTNSCGTLNHWEYGNLAKECGLSAYVMCNDGKPVMVVFGM